MPRFEAVVMLVQWIASGGRRAALSQVAVRAARAGAREVGGRAASSSLLLPSWLHGSVGLICRGLGLMAKAPDSQSGSQLLW